MSRRRHIRHAARGLFATAALAVPAFGVPSMAQAQVQAPEKPLVEPRPPRWTLGLGAHETWDSRTQSDTADVGRLGTRLSADLSHSRTGRRGDLTFGAAASGWKYQGEEEGLRLTHEASLAGAVRVGRRLRVSVAEEFRTDYADEDPLLLEEGTVLPRVVSHRNSARLGLTFARSPRTEFSGSVRHDLVDLDSEALVGRSRVGLQAGVRRQVTRSGRLGLDYFGEVRSAAGENGLAQRASVGWDYAPRGRVGASASAGVQRLERLDTGAQHLEPYGAAGVWFRGRAGSLALRYEHGLALSYRSVREQRSDVVALSASRTLTRRLSLGVHSSYAVRRDLDGVSPQDRMQRHGATVGFEAAKGLRMGLDYSYLQRAGEEAAAGRHRLGASLAYGHGWR